MGEVVNFKPRKQVPLGLTIWRKLTPKDRLDQVRAETRTHTAGELHGWANRLTQDKLLDALPASGLPQPLNAGVGNDGALKIRWDNDNNKLEISLDQAGQCLIRHLDKASGTEIVYKYRPQEGGIDGLFRACKELLGT